MKKIAGIVTIVLFIFIFVAVAQEKSAEIQTAQWHRLQSDNGEFSIEVPAEYGFFADKVTKTVGYNFDIY